MCSVLNAQNKCPICWEIEIKKMYIACTFSLILDKIFMFSFKCMCKTSLTCGKTMFNKY